MKNYNQGENDKCHNLGINLKFIKKKKPSSDSDNSENIGEFRILGFHPVELNSVFSVHMTHLEIWLKYRF